MSSAPQRADARRNRVRLLETAHDLFAERGTDASLEEVARRAGVAIGTLYRHFPTRDDLLVGLFARHSGTYRGLPRSVLVGLDEEGSPLHASCSRMQGGAARLMAAAQEAGAVRADVSTEDVLAIVAGIAWVVEQVGGEGRAERLLGLVRDAIAVVR